jgi:hypothetical protein
VASARAAASDRPPEIAVAVSDRGKSARVSDFRASGGKNRKIECGRADGRGRGRADCRIAGQIGPGPEAVRTPAAAQEPGAGFPLVYRWNFADRKGRRCRIVARGPRNARLIEFDDGQRLATLGNALQRAK